MPRVVGVVVFLAKFVGYYMVIHVVACLLQDRGSQSGENNSNYGSWWVVGASKGKRGANLDPHRRSDPATPLAWSSVTY